MQPLIGSLILRIGFWGSLCSVVVLSLLPVDQLPSQVSIVWDKAQHAAGFAFLACMGMGAYPRRPWTVGLGLLVTGAFIEWAQQYSGWRHGDVMDLLADAVGIALGLIIWCFGLGRKTVFPAE